MLVSLTPNTSKYNSFEGKANNKKLQVKPAYSQVNFSGDNLDDGRIGFKNATKHFLKGVFSPFTMLFSSVKNFAMGAGIIAGGALLCSAFPPLLPVMAAVGIVTGGVQIVKGAYNSLTAETDKKKEKAFEDMGSGTLAVTLSAVGAKGSLKAAGVENADNLNILRATYRCFREIPAGFTRSVKMAKNGTALVNFKNTFNVKSVLVPDADDIAALQKAGYNPEKLNEIKAYSQILHDDAVKNIYATVKPNKPYHPVNNPYSKDSYITKALDLFPEEIRGNFKFRAKSASAIKDRLIREMVKNNKTVNSLDDAKGLMKDLVGYRLILEDASEPALNALVDSLSDSIIKGKLKVLEVENYCGKNVRPYFNEFNIDKLTESGLIYAKQSGTPFSNIQASIPKKSGYTTAQINVKYKNGLLGEFQIRGKEIHRLADIEHIAYNLRQGKDLSYNKPLLQKIFAKTTTNLQRLSDDGYAAYSKYLNDSYKYSRNLELGTGHVGKPDLLSYMKGNPDKFLSAQGKLKAGEALDDILRAIDIDALGEIKSQTKWLERIPNHEFIEMVRQNALVYPGVENFVAKNNNEYIYV